MLALALAVTLPGRRAARSGGACAGPGCRCSGCRPRSPGHAVRTGRGTGAIRERPARPLGRLCAPMSRAGWRSSRGRSPRCSTRWPQRYDRTNTILSGRAGPALAAARGRARCGCVPGSGCSTSPPAPASPPSALAATGAWCVATDFSLGMLAAAKASGLPAGGRRRAAPAVRRRRLRRGDDLVRPAQRARTRRPRCGSSPG